MWPIFLILYFCLLSSSFLILHVVCRVVVGHVCHLRQGALRAPFIRVSSSRHQEGLGFAAQLWCLTC